MKNPITALSKMEGKINVAKDRDKLKQLIESFENFTQILNDKNDTEIDFIDTNNNYKNAKRQKTNSDTVESTFLLKKELTKISNQLHQKEVECKNLEKELNQKMETQNNLEYKVNNLKKQLLDLSKKNNNDVYKACLLAEQNTSTNEKLRAEKFQSNTLTRQLNKLSNVYQDGQKHYEEMKSKFQTIEHGIISCLKYTLDPNKDVKDQITITDISMNDMKEETTNTDLCMLNVRDGTTNTESSINDLRDKTTNTEPHLNDVYDKTTNTDQSMINLKDETTNTDQSIINLKDGSSNTDIPIKTEIGRESNICTKDTNSQTILSFNDELFLDSRRHTINNDMPTTLLDSNKIDNHIQYDNTEKQHLRELNTKIGKLPDIKNEKALSRLCGSNPLMQKHMNKRIQNLATTCKKCTRVFYQKTNFPLHSIFYHSIHNKFNCSYCPRTFRGQVPLDAHLQGFHPLSLDTKVCTTINLSQPSNFKRVRDVSYDNIDLIGTSKKTSFDTKLGLDGVKQEYDGRPSNNIPIEVVTSETEIHKNEFTMNLNNMKKETRSDLAIQENQIGSSESDISCEFCNFHTLDENEFYGHLETHFGDKKNESPPTTAPTENKEISLTIHDLSLPSLTSPYNYSTMPTRTDQKDPISPPMVQALGPISSFRLTNDRSPRPEPLIRDLAPCSPMPNFNSVLPVMDKSNVVRPVGDFNTFTQNNKDDFPQSSTQEENMELPPIVQKFDLPPFDSNTRNLVNTFDTSEISNNTPPMVQSLGPISSLSFDENSNMNLRSLLEKNISEPAKSPLESKYLSLPDTSSMVRPVCDFNSFQQNNNDKHQQSPNHQENIELPSISSFDIPRLSSNFLDSLNLPKSPEKIVDSPPSVPRLPRIPSPIVDTDSETRPPHQMGHTPVLENPPPPQGHPDSNNLHSNDQRTMVRPFSDFHAFQQKWEDITSKFAPKPDSTSNSNLLSEKEQNFSNNLNISQATHNSLMNIFQTQAPKPPEFLNNNIPKFDHGVKQHDENRNEPPPFPFNPVKWNSTNDPIVPRMEEAPRKPTFLVSTEMDNRWVGFAERIKQAYVAQNDRQPPPPPSFDPALRFFPQQQDRIPERNENDENDRQPPPHPSFDPALRFFPLQQDRIPERHENNFNAPPINNINFDPSNFSNTNMESQHQNPSFDPSRFFPPQQDKIPEMNETNCPPPVSENINFDPSKPINDSNFPPQMNFDPTKQPNIENGRGGNKSFKCDICEFVTAHKRNLGFHVKAVHFKQKDFVCEQCQFATALKQSLHRHMKTVHGQESSASNSAGNSKEFRCDQCDFNATVKHELMRHYKVVHKSIQGFIQKFHTG